MVTKATIHSEGGAIVPTEALINIWATWCPPCRAEMPTIEAAYAQYRDQGLTVLAANLQEDSRSVAAFMQEHSLTFPAYRG